MNLIVITAVIAVCGAAKLDRTYLPPPSAKTAGGSPGSLQTPFAGNSFNEGLGGLPKGSYTNEFQGVVVDAANAGTRASGPEDSGLGAPRISYGSTASKVGEAAFKGSLAGFRQFPGGSQGQNVARDGQIAGTHISSQGLSHGFPSQGTQVSTRPQAASERSSNTLKFESDVGPESFNYAFETENGILAEENGVEANGVQAKGGFSYVGDNGQVYSVAYTADEGGYQPKGDHLPTPPPIPPEILKSLEQNAREEAAGIIDDGSYDAQKYNEGSDYTESDSANGQYNNRQSNRSGNRPESDATASGTFISQNNQPFGSPNRLPGHTSSIDKSTDGFGSLNGNLPQSSQSGAFGSKNEYLPPSGQSGRPAQGLNPGSATSPDSSSKFDQASNSLTSNFQPLNNQFNGRPQSSHISATSAFVSGSQPSTGSQLGQQQQPGGFQQKQPSPGRPNQLTQNVHGNLPSAGQGITQFSSATSQDGAQSNQPQNQATGFGSLNSQRATSPPQIVLTTPHESSPSSSQQSSDASSSPSQTSSSAIASSNSQSLIGRPIQPHIGIQSNSGFQHNIQGEAQFPGSTQGSQAQGPTLSVPTQPSNFGSQNLNSRPFGLQNQQQSLSIQGQELRPSSSFGSFNAQSLPSGLQGTSSRPLNVLNEKQTFGIQGQGSPTSTPGSFGSQSFTAGLQGSSSRPFGAQSVDQTSNNQGQGSTTSKVFGSSSGQPIISGLPSFPSQPFGTKNQGQSSLTQGQGSTPSDSASFNSQSSISRPVGSGSRPFGSQNRDQTLNLHSQNFSQVPATSSAIPSLNSQSPTIGTQSYNSRPAGITSGLQTQTSAISSLGPQIQGQVSQFGNKQLQSSANRPSQDSESAQKPSFGQAQSPDYSYYYNQPSRPFSTPNAQIQNTRFPSTPSNQFNRVTQQPLFSSQSSAQISNTQLGIPSTPFPQSGLQGSTGNPLESVAPTSPTQGKPGQFPAGTFPSAFNGITQASASSFAAASPTTSTQFSGQQPGQFGSRPSFQQSSTQFHSNLAQPLPNVQPSVSSFGQKTTAISQIPGQFGKKPGSLQGPTQTFGQRPTINQGQPGSALDESGSSPSVPTQQYNGEIYEYKKPPQSLPVPSQKESSSSTQFGQKNQVTQSSIQSSSRPQFGQSQGSPDAQSSPSTQIGSQQPSQSSFGIQSPRPQFVQGIQPTQATQFSDQTSQGQAQQSSTRPQVGTQPSGSFGITHSTQSPQFNAQGLRPQEPHTAQDYRLQSGAASSRPFSGTQSTESAQINAHGPSSQQPQNPKDTTAQFNVQGSGKPTTSCCQGITSGQDAAKPTQGFQFGSTSAGRPNFGAQTPNSSAQTSDFGTQIQGFSVQQPSQGVSAHAESQFSSPGSSFPGSQNLKPNQFTSQSVAGKGEVFGGPRNPPSFDEQSGYVY